MVVNEVITISGNYIKKILKPHMNSFSATELNIAEYFVVLGMDLVNKTLANLSEETSYSEATIFKFVKKLGFKGFQDFKISVASNYHINEERSHQLAVFTDISSSDKPIDISNKVIHSSQIMLEGLLASLTNEVLQKALDLITQSKGLHFFGIGASSVIALDTYQKFLRTSIPVHYVADYHMQLMHVSKLTEDDCVFLFSHSGKTVETIRLAEVAKQCHAKIIYLTGNPAGRINVLSDVSIVVETEESVFQSEALAARILYLTIVDIIYLSYLYKDENKNIHSIDTIRQILSTTKEKDEKV